MNEEISKAWAEFTMDAEKAKEDCCVCYVFDDALPTEVSEEQSWISFSIMGLVVFLVAAFYVFMYMTSENKKTNIKKTKNKETKIKETKNMGSKVKKNKIKETNIKKTKKT